MTIREPGTEVHEFEAIAALLDAAWAAQYAHPRQSHDQAAQALAMATALGSARQVAWAQLCIGYYQLRSGDLTGAKRSLDAATATFVGLDDKRGLLLATNGQGRLAMMEGQAADALDIFLRNRAEVHPDITPLDRFYTLNGLAGCYWESGQWSESLGHAFEALSLLRGLDAKHQLAALLSNLGGQLVDVGDFEAARELLTEAIGITEGFAHAVLQLGLRANLIHCLLELQRPGEALPLARELAASTQLALVTPAEADIMHAAAEAFIVNHCWQEARVCLGHGQRIGEQCSSADVMAVNTWLEGLCAHEQGDLATAISVLTKAGDMLASTQLLTTKCKVFRLLAAATAAVGRFEEAYRHQHVYFSHYDARLGIASRAHYHALQIRYELARMREQRDLAERSRLDSERAKAELQALNQSLQEKILQVESLQGQLREQALRDPLTGLHNRRYLEPALDDLIAMAKRAGTPLSVAMIDLDHFKHVNDQFGHLFGDQVLVCMAKLLHSSTRASDVVCRYGGEEFCLVLPDTGAEQAMHKLQALLALANTTVVSAEGHQVAGMPFSAGVASFDGTHQTAAALLRTADLALYEAKEAGRNQVRQQIGSDIPQGALGHGKGQS